MNKYLLLAIAAASVSSFLLYNHTDLAASASDFETFKAKFGRSYANDQEEAYRFAVYTANMKDINEHNAKENETYKLGETQFTDLHEEEFKAIYLGFKQTGAEDEEFDLATSEEFVVLSIGSPKEKYKKLKTKDNVDPVGLSPPLPLLNLLPELAPVPLEISLNNRSYLAVQFPT